MKAISMFKKAAALTAAMALVGVYLLSARGASAIPYTPDTKGLTHPGFNIYTGVPSEGDESDFFRGKEETDPNPSVTNVQSACTNGTRYTLRVYVHNGGNQSLNNNGTGPVVAHGTKVRVALPQPDTANKFKFNSVISATNATTVADDMTINCGGGKVVKLNYVNGSAKQFTANTGTKALSDSIVTTGAPVGSFEPNGDVWGCFHERVWVTLTVEVKEVPKPSLGECKLLDMKATNGRRVTTDITADVSNATVVGYKVDFGDGTTSDKQKDEHEYAKDGTYNLTAQVNIKFADGHTEWKGSNACTASITFTPEQPPQVTPPTPTPPTPTALPETGPAGVAGIASLVSAISSLGYYFVKRRGGLEG